MGFDLMGPFHNFLKDGVLAFAEATWEFVKGAFGAGAMTQEWWAAVVGGQLTVVVGTESTVVDHPGMLNVVTLAMVPLLLILVAIQVVFSLVRGSTAGLLRALAVAVFAVPSIYVLAGLVWLVLAGVDDLTQGILEVGSDGDEDAVGDIVALFGMTVDSATGAVMLDTNYEHWAIMDDEGAMGKTILSFIIAGILFLCGLLLVLMMIFRLVAIIVLVIFMPVAIYGLAAEAAKAMTSRWLSLVVALIIAKPAAAVIIKTGLTLASVGSSWVQLVAGVVLVLVAALAPILTLTFIAFMTGGASDSMERAAIAGAVTTVGTAASAQRATGGALRTTSRAAGAISRAGKRQGGGTSPLARNGRSSPNTVGAQPQQARTSPPRAHGQGQHRPQQSSEQDSGAQATGGGHRQASAGSEYGPQQSRRPSGQHRTSMAGSESRAQTAAGTESGSSARRSRRGEEM